jgi:hypothetical protein
MPDIYIPTERFNALAEAIVRRSGGTIDLSDAKMILCEHDVWPEVILGDKAS